MPHGGAVSDGGSHDVIMAGHGVPGLTALNADFEAILRQCLDGSIGPDTQLREETDLATLGIDSLTVVRLLVMIEDTFRVTIPDEIIAFELFSSPGALWAVVSDLMEEQRAR